MLRAGHIVVFGALALLILGVVMVTSANFRIDPLPDSAQIATEGAAAGNATAQAGITGRLAGVLTTRPFVYFGLAAGAMIVGALLPLSALVRLSGKLENFGPLARRALTHNAVFGAVCVVLIAGLVSVYIPGIADPQKGAHRWVRFPGVPFSFQPSEIAKWAGLAAIAWYAAARGLQVRSLLTCVLPASIMYAGAIGVILLDDLGTAVLMGAVFAVMLYVAGARLWHLAALSAATVPMFFLAIWYSPYRIQRLIAFIDPYADPKDTGYHIIHSMLAIAGGSGGGRGLGFSLQKLGYLPECHTDFLFAIICEELGPFGAVLVVALFLAVIWAGYLIVRREPDRVLKLFGFGVLATFAFQCVMNLFVVTGMGPTKGIALPLVSHGGTGWIMTALCLGVIAGMDRRHARLAAQPESKAGASLGYA